MFVSVGLSLVASCDFYISFQGKNWNFTQKGTVYETSVGQNSRNGDLVLLLTLRSCSRCCHFGQLAKVKNWKAKTTADTLGQPFSVLLGPLVGRRTYARACHITPVKGANESDGDKWANSYPSIEITIFGDNARYSASESGSFVPRMHGFNKHQSLQNEHLTPWLGTAHQSYGSEAKRVV